MLKILLFSAYFHMAGEDDEVWLRLHVPLSLTPVVSATIVPESKGDLTNE